MFPASLVEKYRITWEGGSRPKVLQASTTATTESYHITAGYKGGAVHKLHHTEPFA